PPCRRTRVAGRQHPYPLLLQAQVPLPHLPPQVRPRAGRGRRAGHLCAAAARRAQGAALGARLPHPGGQGVFGAAEKDAQQPAAAALVGAGRGGADGVRAQLGRARAGPDARRVCGAGLGVA
ncbi:hypothetical protein TSOC_009415, partial [Tetrabaena socialis]